MEKNVNKIIEIINEKRKKYLNKYNINPKKIEISHKFLVRLYIHFLYLQDTPYHELKTLFGMEIVINDNIKRVGNIKVY